MKRRRSKQRPQEDLSPKEGLEPAAAEETRELVRALANLLLEALGHRVGKESDDESEDHR